MIWALANWKSIVVAVCAFMIGASAGKIYGHYQGIGIGKELRTAEIIAAQQEADQKIRQRKRDARHETQPMDRPAIVRELCRRERVRNPAHCPD